MFETSPVHKCPNQWLTFKLEVLQKSFSIHSEIHNQKERRPKTLKKGKKEEEHLGKGEVHGEEAGEREREEEGRLKEREEA